MLITSHMILQARQPVTLCHCSSLQQTILKKKSHDLARVSTTNEQVSDEQGSTPGFEGF